MGFGPFSSSSDTRTRVTNSNSSVNQAEGASAFTPRISSAKGNVSAAVTESGIAVTGNKNTITLTDFGAIQAASQILDRTLQSQANVTLQALGFSKELAETKVSDGANITAKTLRIALCVLAALAAIYFVFRR